MHRRKNYFALLAGVLLLSLSAQAFAHDEVIKERQKLMRINDKQVKAIKKAIARKDFGPVEASANLIVANMGKVLDLFPRGSTSKKSKAKAEIWEKWDDFTQKMTNLVQAAGALSKAAAAKDETQVSLKAKAVGLWDSGACGACHKSFYKPRKKRR